MNKQDITNLINSKIIDNDNGLITAEKLRAVLNAINEGTGDGYIFISTATPSTTPIAITGDSKVFYIATEEGNYSNYGLGDVTELSIIRSNCGAWSAESLGINFNKLFYAANPSFKNFAESINNSLFFYFDPKKIGIGGSIVDTAASEDSLSILLYNGVLHLYNSQTRLGLIDLKNYQTGELIVVNDYWSLMFNSTAFQETNVTSVGFVMLNNDYISQKHNLFAKIHEDIAKNSEDIAKNSEDIQGIEESLDVIMTEEPCYEKALDFGVKDSPEKNTLYNNAGAVTGAGWYLGIVDKPIRFIELYVYNSGTKTDSNTMTSFRLTLRKNNYAGEILFSNLFNANIPVNTTDKITCDLGEEISFEDPLYITFQFNAYCFPVIGDSSDYPYDDNRPRASYDTGKSTSQKILALSTAHQKDGLVFIKIYSDISYKKTVSEEFIQEISERIEFPEVEVVESINISLPDKLYAVVGDTFQLFYRGCIQAVNPYNYNILVSCAKGKQFPRYFEYTPSLSDIGSVDFKITVKDSNGKTLGEKSCTLVTVAAGSSPSSQKNILCFGDSLTYPGKWCAEAFRRLTETGGTPAGRGFNNIRFCGSMNKDGAGYFGKGGWNWYNYLIAGSTSYRFYVTGVNTLNIGSVYTNNGVSFAIKEVNVTFGNGNILCSYTSGNPQQAGTLVKSSGDGDAEIVYTSCEKDASNPLWDAENNKLSFIPYANEHCDGQIDLVYTLLSWNGLTPWKVNFDDIKSHIRKIADTLHAEFPNAKLKLLGIQVNSINGGMGANYGATGNSYADTYGNVVTVLNQNIAYQELANEEQYSDFVEFVNVSSQFDSENNCQEAEFPVNIRNSKKEMRGTNGVHPADSGYNQIADVVYRNLIKEICQ